MQLRYVGEHDETETFGRVFKKRKWTDVNDLSPEFVARLSTNPQFEAFDDEAEPEKSPASGPPTA